MASGPGRVALQVTAPLEDSRAAPSPDGGGARRHLLGWIVPAGLALWTFPAVTPPGSAGVDGAWILEINRLAVSRHHFGREVAFTYGPLGRLLYPVDTGSHLVQASLLRFAFAVAFGLALARVLRRAKGRWMVAAAALAQVVAFALGLDSSYFGFEYQLMLLLPLLAWEAVEVRSAPGLAAVSGLAVLALFAKITLGAGSIAAVGTAGALAALRRDWRALAGAAVGGTAALAASAWLLFPSPGDLVPWLRDSLEIAMGYSEAMSQPGKWGLTLGGVAALIGFLGLAVWLYLRRSPAAGLALVFVAPAFLAYKHAFVRQELVHTPIFFTFVAGVLGLLAARAERGPPRAAILAGLAIASLLAVPARYAERERWDFPVRALGGWAGLTNLVAWASLDDLRRARTDHLLAGDAAPGLKEVTGDSLGVVPWELGYCVANGIDCVPNPTLQTFAAYTSRLDRASALHYAGPSAPHFVLFGAGAIDARQIAFDTPATWRALTTCFGLAPIQPTADPLLARRSGPCLQPESPLGTVAARFEQWIPVPESPTPVSAAVSLELSWVGRAVRAVHRVLPVYVELGLRSGRTRRFRIIPDTARNGLPIDLAPDDVGDIPRILRGEPPVDRVQRIRLSGEGTPWYRQPFEVAFTAAAP